MLTNTHGYKNIIKEKIPIFESHTIYAEIPLTLPRILSVFKILTLNNFHIEFAKAFYVECYIKFNIIINTVIIYRHRNKHISKN